MELVSHTDFCVINSHKLTDEKNETVAAHGVERGFLSWDGWIDSMALMTLLKRDSTDFFRLGK